MAIHNMTTPGLSDMSYADAASQLGCSVQSLYRLMRRAGVAGRKRPMVRTLYLTSEDLARLVRAKTNAKSASATPKRR